MAYPIFISYREKDCEDEVRHLYDHLARHFGEDASFWDKERLTSGDPWRDELQINASQCQVLLCLIKNESVWLGVNKFGTDRRINNAEDWVRLEVELALENSCFVIPVLFGDNTEVPPIDALPSDTLKRLHVPQVHKMEHKWQNIADLINAIDKKTTIKKVTRSASARLNHEYPLPEDSYSAVWKSPKDFDYRTNPYQGFNSFSEEAAPLFFGRSKELIHLFDLIRNPNIQIICVHGESGVGKSSFLAAGAVQRLKNFRQPLHAKRDKDKSWVTQFEQLCQRYQPNEAAPVFIFDQAEEIFSDPRMGESDEFVYALKNALSTHQEATVVLGFRQDFDKEITQLLSSLNCSKVKIPLTPLSYPALVEAIEGVVEDPILQAHYKIRLESNFAENVALDLIQSETGSTLCSILQGLLAEMYKVRPGNNGANPENSIGTFRYFYFKDYKTLKSKRSCEEDFLNFKLDKLWRDFPELFANQADLFEFLEKFVSDKPTAIPIDRNDLSSDENQWLNPLRKVNLLTFSDGEQYVRLSSDLFAPLVREQLPRLQKNIKVVAEERRKKDEEKRKEDEKSHQFPFDKEPVGDAIISLEDWISSLSRFEQAFLYLHAHKLKEAIYALRICYRLAPQKNELLLNVPFHKATRIDLLLLLKSLNEPLFSILENQYLPNMVFVPSGVLKSDTAIGRTDTKEIEGFWISDTQTTCRQYGLFCLAKQWKLPEEWVPTSLPVRFVDWFDAIEFANWLSINLGLQPAYLVDARRNSDKEQYTYHNVICNGNTNGFRLPTEHEWEFAASAASKSALFGNGKNIANPAEMNFRPPSFKTEALAIKGSFRGKPTPVQNFLPNKLGLYDMSGNVWEWCWDLQLEEDSSENRITRGGSFLEKAIDCQVISTRSKQPTALLLDLGFRLVRSK